MSAFLAHFDGRKAEIDEYFNLVDFLENYTVEKGKKLEYVVNDKTISTKIEDEHKKILRANCYMMLYNLVEGSITEAMDAIFEQISSKNLEFELLTDTYKKIWLNYQQGLVKITAVRAKEKTEELRANNRVNKPLSYVLKYLKYFNILTFTEPKSKKIDDPPPTEYENYRAYLKVVESAEISGNMDARIIREDLAIKYDFYQIPMELNYISVRLETILTILAEKYDYTGQAWSRKRIELLKLECNELLVIKKKRNQLAHGEMVFSDAGEAHSIKELINIKKNIFMYLEFILLNINDFIENEGFKTPIQIK